MLMDRLKSVKESDYHVSIRTWLRPWSMAINPSYNIISYKMHQTNEIRIFSSTLSQHTEEIHPDSGMFSKSFK